MNQGGPAGPFGVAVRAPSLWLAETQGEEGHVFVLGEGRVERLLVAHQGSLGPRR